MIEDKFKSCPNNGHGLHLKNDFLAQNEELYFKIRVIMTLMFPKITIASEKKPLSVFSAKEAIALNFSERNNCNTRSQYIAISNMKMKLFVLCIRCENITLQEKDEFWNYLTNVESIKKTLENRKTNDRPLFYLHNSL